MLILLVVFAVAFAYRTFIAVFMADPGGGDWITYSRVTANIVRGCGVSLSDPVPADCVPQFGGNGLPGYPFFIAGVWTLAGRSQTALLLTQCLLASVAIRD